MDFLKKHGEKLLVVLMLLTLGGSVLLVLQKRGGFDDPDSLNRTPPKGDIQKDTQAVETALARITTNPPRVDVGMDTFTPQVRVICVNPQDRSLIPPDMAVCPYCGAEQTLAPRDSDNDGIPDRQEAQWGMNPNDPSDVNRDLDDDGFPTLFEYRKGTDPTNAEDFPELIDFLRFTNVERASVQFELLGTAKVGDTYTLQLRWAYPDGSQPSTDYVKVGTRFGRENEFLAESFVKNIVPRGNKYVDESRATIRSGRHQLKLGRVGEATTGRITESTATLELIFGPEWSERVRVGETFTLDKKSYKVVDIRKNTVLIRADDAETAIRIGPPTTEEEEALNPPDPSNADDEALYDAMGLSMEPPSESDQE